LKKAAFGRLFFAQICPMKTLLPVLLILLLSCKKEYTCTCTTTAKADIPGVTTYDLGTQTQQHTAKLKKKEKDEWCKSFENTTTSNQSVLPGISVNATVVTTCAL
jgi:hypothetical protein